MRYYAWLYVIKNPTGMLWWKRRSSRKWSQFGPHLSLWSPLSCPCLPLERCCPTLSFWRSESCAALSAPARCRRASGAIGWLVAGFAVIGCAAGRPASPGNLLGWGLMRSWWGGGCWLGLAYNDSGESRIRKGRGQRMQANIVTKLTNITTL